MHYQQVFEIHATTLKALANPKRLEIINLLRDQTLNVNQMIEMLGLPQANLSQHLQVLREARVLNSHKKGKQVFYKISHPNFVQACDLVREIIATRFQNQDQNLAQKLSTNMEDFLPLAHDPVCDMRICPKTASFATNYQNQNYYFCASGCLEKFEKNPHQFINKKSSIIKRQNKNLNNAK